jgi:hypothetical protein
MSIPVGTDLMRGVGTSTNTSSYLIERGSEGVIDRGCGSRGDRASGSTYLVGLPSLSRGVALYDAIQRRLLRTESGLTRTRRLDAPERSSAMVRCMRLIGEGGLCKRSVFLLATTPQTWLRIDTHWGE